MYDLCMISNNDCVSAPKNSRAACTIGEAGSGPSHKNIHSVLIKACTLMLSPLRTACTPILAHGQQVLT